MRLNISLYIALRYWRAKSAERFGRLVTYLASVGIMLGVMALIIVLAIMNGLERQQKQQVLANIPHAILTPPQGYVRYDEQPLELPNSVEKAIPINQTNAILQSHHSVSAGLVIGIRAFSDDPLLANLPAQDFDHWLPAGQFNIMIGSRLAQQLQLNVGDKVRVMLTENSQYTPLGRVPTQRLFTVSQIYYSNADVSSYQVFTNLADIGRLMRLSNEQFQGYRLFLSDPFDIVKLPELIAQDWHISDWRSQKGEFFQAVRMEKNMMGLLISLIIIVAVSNIVTSLSLMVMDKQGEVAILQTQGITKAQVRHIFIYQGMFVGLVGSLIGTLLGVVISINLADILQWFNQDIIHLPTLIHYPQIIGIFLFSLLLSLLSTIYPAYRASKIEPAEALRYE
ncbi:lipoprotein-releasing ABC transporter permease subunit [Volucribacter amazonae]|uniref:Permease n=1 Tax=Volucribacter amazonae TaxID=256731 RepID=A0A9X4P7W2_9PAST|nr:lipoprotein-releasing ABC transporter permease subunit [Volucribacter amazonae]MDG6894260.1 permease [Volucribacter amazonae]